MDNFIGFVVVCVIIYFIIKYLVKKYNENSPGRQSGTPFNKSMSSYQAMPSVQIPTYNQIWPSKGQRIDRFITLDFETTGINWQREEAIEISMAKYENWTKVDSFHTLINPKRRIPPESTRIHGITDDMVCSAPTIDNLIQSIANFLGDGSMPIIAHNADFDMKFLLKYMTLNRYQLTNSIICTVSLSRSRIPQLVNHKLGTVAKALNIQQDKAHRADSDCETVAEIFKCLQYQDALESYNIANSIAKNQPMTPEELAAFEEIRNQIKVAAPDCNIYYRKTAQGVGVIYKNYQIMFYKWGPRVKYITFINLPGFTAIDRIDMVSLTDILNNKEQILTSYANALVGIK